MNYSKTLAKIPVVVEGSRPPQKLYWSRRAFQIGVLILALLVPVTGLFRIDPVDGAFIVLDRQIWFSDFFIVVGLWLAISSALVITYSLIGTAFCGWACPQNTMSEWANNLNRKLLGKKAEVSLDGAAMRVSQGKNKWYNWLALSVIFMLASLALALIPLFYFYPPDVVWSFVTFRDDARLAGSLHWIYTIFVLIIWLDLAFVRHFFCRFMCVYKIWQHTFKTRETLHIAWDDSHLDECNRCGYCVTSCFLGIDPRNTETYDACINCGECVTACGDIRAKRHSGSSLLKFELGERANRDKYSFRTSVGSLVSRVKWTIPLVVAGLAMFTWGLVTYQPYHMIAGRDDAAQTVDGGIYRISIANKLYEPAAMTVSIEGLPAGSYKLSRERVDFASTGRQDVRLEVSPQLSKGLHPILVKVRANDGWEKSFRLQHFANPAGEVAS